MKSQQKPAVVIRVANALITLAIVLMILGGVTFAITAVVGPFGDPATVAMDVAVPVDSLDTLPSTARLKNPVPVSVELSELSAKQKVGLVGMYAPAVAVGLVLMFLLRRIVLSVRDGDPFSAANVRRLNIIGLVLIVGDPIGAYLLQLFAGMAVEEAGVTTTISWNIPGPFQLVGVFVLVIAQVFAHGVRLREDVEGTV